MKDEYDFSKGRRGPVVPLPENKLRITIRLDKEVVEWFKAKVVAACGGNYQTLINDALREHMKNNGESIEKMVRRVMREELAATKGADAQKTAGLRAKNMAKRAA